MKRKWLDIITETFLESRLIHYINSIEIGRPVENLDHDTIT